MKTRYERVALFDDGRQVDETERRSPSFSSPSTLIPNLHDGHFITLVCT